MELLLDLIVIVVFQSIGVAANVLKEIKNIRKESPSLSPNEVWSIVKQKDWDTFIGSVVILVLAISVRVVMFIEKVPHTGWMAEWWFTMAQSAVLGFAGQEILFRWLGTAKDKALSMAGGSKITTVVSQDTPEETKTKVTTETITPKDTSDKPHNQ